MQRSHSRAKITSVLQHSVFHIKDVSHIHVLTIISAHQQKLLKLIIARGITQIL
jgi:hypothetical protein